MDIDPAYLSYSVVPNGVPQESKLATYMKRQPDRIPQLATVSSPVSKRISSINGVDQLSSSLRKMGVQSAEFVPRPNLASYSNSVSPTHRQAATPSPTSIVAQAAPPFEKNVQTYQENVGGTTYFYPQSTVVPPVVSEDNNSAIVDEASTSGVANASGVTVYPGTPSHLRNKNNPPPTDPAASYFVNNSIRLEIQYKNSLVLAQTDPEQFPDLPTEVDNYHELVPLEPPRPLHKQSMLGYQATTYKATHIKTGIRYCLRRIHDYRLPSTKCTILVDMWKKLSHSNIVQLREVFTTKCFGDHSIIFVYDYHPDSETFQSRYFSQAEPLNGFNDLFSSNSHQPRPYSHMKNALLRQQQSMIPESTIWNYVIQLTGALRVIHSAGLAFRTLDASKVILNSRSRIRLSFCAITDVLSFDPNASNPLALIPHLQQEDLTQLGKLILALVHKSLFAVQAENLQTSLDLMARSYSADLRHLVTYLLSQQRRTVVDLMPMIGARFYSQLDATQIQCDCLENELAKEIENGRLFRLLVKLGTINERPELHLDPAWSETGDRYMVKLLRDYLFHQVTEDGRPWLDLSHIVHCLNKLDAGTQEKICLMSRDEQSILVVSYAELKQCVEQSFSELVNTATSVTAKVE